MIDIEDDKEALLIQWQTCVEMANSVSQRRDVMNGLFVTLNLALIAAATVVWDMKTIFIVLAGVAICIVWIFSIKNYRLLNTEKFKEINEMESLLPSQPFTNEWKSLKNREKYVEETKNGNYITYYFYYITYNYNNIYNNSNYYGGINDI